MAVLKPYKGTYFLWDYVPSLALGVVFTLLFAVATGWVTWRMVKTRTRFSIPFVIGGGFEIVGYLGRIISTNMTDQLGPYILQSVLILVAPALFAASIYMTLGRLIRSVGGERHSLVPVRWLTRLFVGGDIFSFLLQSNGGGLLASSSPSTAKTGENIILGGLVLQIAMFGFFAATAAVFDVRLRRWPTEESLKADSPWKRVMWMLYAASALIMVRSVFRVVEYIMGRDGYLLQHEWPTYVFDAALMLGTMVVFAWWYPGELKVVSKTRSWEEVESAGPSVPGTADDGAYPLKGVSPVGRS